MILKETYRLSNGVLIPKVGFGTWQITDPNEAYNSVLVALKTGYTHIDTAYVYDNEEYVGKAIKDSKINRENLFITTKLPAAVKEYDWGMNIFKKSLERLGLTYFDLYLIHAPWPWDDQGGDYNEGNLKVWKLLIDLYNQGLVKSIGVSNFEIKHLEYIIKHTGFVPHVNQIPFYIGKDQKELMEYCEKNNILVEAYSPLQTGKIFNQPIVHEMANKYKVTPAQIAIRYTIEKGTLPLPKSVTESRIIENSKLDFKISKEDISILDNI